MGTLCLGGWRGLRKWWGPTLVTGSPAKEMRFRPQRQTDSVVILLSNRQIGSVIRKSRKDSPNLSGLFVRMNQEILKLVHSRWNKKTHAQPYVIYILLGPHVANGDMSDDSY